MNRAAFFPSGLFALALLSACVMPPDTNPPSPVVSSETGAGVAAEGNDSSVMSGTGTVVDKRMLPHGVLERGLIDAPVTLLIFTEYHCSYCKEFEEDILPRLEADFISPGKLKVQTVIFPLEKYEGSGEAVAALLCGARQQQGLSMHEKLFSEGTTTRAAFLRYADELSLDNQEFQNCMNNPEITTIIENQKTWAASLGVELVPTFFLDGEKSVGLPYYADLRGMIESALKTR